jgi:uncharacterized YigZ family protein
VLTIEGAFTAEHEVKHSRFIGNICGAKNKQEAMKFVKATKSRFADATHNVFAFIIQECNCRLQKSNDDKEPKGTAGLPVLGVLQNHNLVNVVIVVTRYFGGTLLGAGGLVRAYSAVAQKAVECANLVTVKNYIKIEITIDYGLYNSVIGLIDKFDVVVEETIFLEKVHLRIGVCDCIFSTFKESVFGACAGKVIWGLE